jgi:hypothetical protein
MVFLSVCLFKQYYDAPHYAISLLFHILSQNQIFFSVLFLVCFLHFEKLEKAYVITFMSVCLPSNVARQKVPGPLLGNGSLKTFPLQGLYTHQQKKRLTRCFLGVRVVSNTQYVMKGK